jgi:hypothetical protein
MDEAMTVRWFGPDWRAPINESENEMSVPLGEKCDRCHLYFDHDEQGVAIPCSPSISENGQVFYHLHCFLAEIGM